MTNQNTDLELKLIISYIGYTIALFQVLNLSNVSSWLGEELEPDDDGFVPNTMLSIPIYNGTRDLIGVAQLINKVVVQMRFQTFNRNLNSVWRGEMPTSFHGGARNPLLLLLHLLESYLEVSKLQIKKEQMKNEKNKLQAFSLQNSPPPQLSGWKADEW